MAAATDTAGAVVALWRYPVKSMRGEELDACEVTGQGLLGDRAFALVDTSDGKVASAKNPRKWARLFEFSAAYAQPPRVGAELPPVRITLPGGALVPDEGGEIHRVLSEELGRAVRLNRRERGQEGIVETTLPNPWTPQLEEYWPDMEGLAYRDVVTDEALPEGTFFDLATVHVLTTATLEHLRELYPEGRFEVPRFRPNLVVEPSDGRTGFVENTWVGKTLAVGDGVRLRITGPCPRCVMTTLPQGDLPKDPGILRTAAQHNGVHVGVYAAVLQGGQVRRGDPVRVE
jgi:uncharacterized protein